MNTPCEIIRDLLPLYVDEVCSPESRSLVDAHLQECSGCRDYLGQLRTKELESGLKEERDEVIRHQALHFRRHSEIVGAVIGGIFAIPILVSLIVNLAAGRALGWFFIVMAAMLVAASLIVVPLMVPEDKPFWTFCAFCASLVLLLGACCQYTHGNWFHVAASAVIFGLSVVFMPFVIRAKPLQKWVNGRNKILLVLAIDLILFANMMNMISLHSKSFLYTVVMSALCVAGLAFLSAESFGKGKDSK